MPSASLPPCRLLSGVPIPSRFRRQSNAPNCGATTRRGSSSVTLGPRAPRRATAAGHRGGRHRVGADDRR
jgi:hypothetical protein